MYIASLTTRPAGKTPRFPHAHPKIHRQLVYGIETQACYENVCCQGDNRTANWVQGLHTFGAATAKPDKAESSEKYKKYHECF